MWIFVRTVQGLDQAIGPHKRILVNGSTRVSLEMCEDPLNYQTLLRAFDSLGFSMRTQTFSAFETLSQLLAHFLYFWYIFSYFLSFWNTFSNSFILSKLLADFDTFLAFGTICYTFSAFCTF